MKRLITVLLVGVMAAALLAGCGPKGRQAGPEAESIEQGESAEQAVSEFLTAIKNKDTETASKYLEKGEKLDTAFEEMSQWGPLYEKLLDFDYEILGSKEEGKSANVEVKFTTYDFEAFFMKMVSDSVDAVLEYTMNAIGTIGSEGGLGNLDEESMQQIISGIVDKNMNLLDKKDQELKLDIDLKKTSDGWKITKGDSITNGIFGGALEEMKDAFSSLVP